LGEQKSYLMVSYYCEFDPYLGVTEKINWNKYRILCVLSIESHMWVIQYVTEENRYGGWITRAPVCARVGCLVSAMEFPLVQQSRSPGPRCAMTECVSPFPPQPKRGKHLTKWKVVSHVIILPKTGLCSSQVFGKTWGWVNDIIDELMSDFLLFLQQQVSWQNWFYFDGCFSTIQV